MDAKYSAFQASDRQTSSTEKLLRGSCKLPCLVSMQWRLGPLENKTFSMQQLEEVKIGNFNLWTLPKNEVREIMIEI